MLTNQKQEARSRIRNISICPNTIIMKQKYFEKTGEIALRLWSYSLILSELKAHPNKEKTKNFYEKVIEFRTSPWMEIKSATEERADLQKIIDELTYMLANFDA